MSHDPPHLCAQLRHALNDSDVPLMYVDNFREYGLRVADGGSSYLLLLFCPFCGCELPRSLRDEWFERLDELGLEPEDPRVPMELRDGSWWRITGD